MLDSIFLGMAIVEPDFETALKLGQSQMMLFCVLAKGAID